MSARSGTRPGVREGSPPLARPSVRARYGPPSLTFRARRAHCPGPAARSAAPLQLPGSRRGRRGGRGQGGARGGGPECEGDAAASASAPGALAAAPGARTASPGGGRNGGRWRRGRGGRPLRGVGWSAQAAHPLDSIPRHRCRPSRTRAARHSRPLAARRPCRPITEARRPAQARGLRRRK